MPYSLLFISQDRIFAFGVVINSLYLMPYYPISFDLTKIAFSY